QVLSGSEALQLAQDLDLEALDPLSVAHVGHAVSGHAGDDPLGGQDVHGLGGPGRGAQTEGSAHREHPGSQDPHVAKNPTAVGLHSLDPAVTAHSLCRFRLCMLRWSSMLAALFQPVRAENLPGSQDPLAIFFRETSPTAKVVLGILLLFSLISWIIIFAKYLR